MSELAKRIEEAELVQSEFGIKEREPFYERVPKGKFRPDKRAIANLDALPRPLAPPGRRPHVEEVREALACEHPECSYCGDEQ